MSYQDLFKHETSTKGNVMTPLNYGSGIMEILGGFVITFSDDTELKYIAIWFCIGWALFYAIIYVVWMFKAPDRLQSESFVLQAQALGLGREQSSSYIASSVVLDTKSLNDLTGSGAQSSANRGKDLSGKT